MKDIEKRTHAQRQPAEQTLSPTSNQKESPQHDLSIIATSARRPVHASERAIRAREVLLAPLSVHERLETGY